MSTATLSIEVVAPPLKADEHGTIRVSGTRVTLETIILTYLQGDSAEDIHEGFPTVPLGDIYAVIAYYLRHQEEVDAYISHQEAEGEKWLKKIEKEFGKGPTRQELLARRQQRILADAAISDR